MRGGGHDSARPLSKWKLKKLTTRFGNSSDQDEDVAAAAGIESIAIQLRDSNAGIPNDDGSGKHANGALDKNWFNVNERQ